MDCGASLCVIKKPRRRGGYSPARGLQNTNLQWVAAPVEEKKLENSSWVNDGITLPTIMVTGGMYFTGDDGMKINTIPQNLYSLKLCGMQQK